MESDQKGLFIVFEGIDGSGTSTQVHELSRRIESLDKYQDIMRTHEPWRSADIKRRLQEDRDAYSDPEEMSRLFVADRVDHSYRLIIPNIDANAIVISSRYKMSTCAFQQAQGVPIETLLKMHGYNNGILTPDITFFLDVPREVASERMRRRGDPSEKFERNAEFIDKVVANYRDLVSLAQRDSDLFGKVLRIDATKSVKEVSEEVYQDFLSVYRTWKGLDFHWSSLLRYPKADTTIDHHYQQKPEGDYQ